MRGFNVCLVFYLKYLLRFVVGGLERLKDKLDSFDISNLFLWSFLMLRR